LNNEERMWLANFKFANPGWNLALGPDFTPTAGMLSANVFVYVADASSGWISSASTTEEQIRIVGERVKQDSRFADETLACCASAILDAGAAKAAPDSENARLSIFLAVAAMAQTKTWDMVRQAQNGKLAGHWLYLVYRTHDDGQVGRPAFLNQPALGFIPPLVLQETIEQVIAADLVSPTVGSFLQEGGGPILHETLRVTLRVGTRS
jgi:hypothetical protein